MSTRNYTGWETIEEEYILQHAMEAGEASHIDEANFLKILAAGAVFKFAELTPVYVWEPGTSRIAVYAEETYGKKLH